MRNEEKQSGRNLSAFPLLIFYNFYCFSGPRDHLIKKDCCLKTIYEVLPKCDRIFLSSLNFHHIPHCSVLVFCSVEFYDCTSTLALGSFILCFPMNKKSFSIKSAFYFGMMK